MMASNPSRISRARRSSGLRAALLVTAVVVLLAGSCSSDDEAADEVTETGFVIEPEDEVGPDAFTASVVDDDGGCDPEKLVEELDSRPEAKAEWARVLGVAEEDVEEYVQTLEPKILESDTMVTNHGLHDGIAYSRPSVLEEGTAVLVDPEFSLSLRQLRPELFTTTTRMTTTTPTTFGIGRGEPVQRPTTTEEESTTTEDEESTTTAGEEGTTTTVVEGAQPVTRCKCGNPLLPAYAPAATGQRLEEPEATTTTTTEDEDETPETQRQTPRTSTTPSTSAGTSSSTSPSTEATSTTQPNVTPSDLDAPDGPG